MKKQEIKDKSWDELHALLREQRSHLQNLRFKVAANEEKNVRGIRRTRLTIAQILTFLRTKKKPHAKS